MLGTQKELIKYKGFQVPPADLEAVLLTHEGIVDSGVIGVYSKKDETELPRYAAYIPSVPLIRRPNVPLRAYVVPRAGAAILQNRAEREKFEKNVEKWIRGKV